MIGSNQVLLIWSSIIIKLTLSQTCSQTSSYADLFQANQIDLAVQSIPQMCFLNPLIDQQNYYCGYYGAFNSSSLLSGTLWQVNITVTNFNQANPTSYVDLILNLDFDLQDGMSQYLQDHSQIEFFPQIVNVTNSQLVSRRNSYQGNCNSNELCTSLTIQNLKIQKDSKNILIAVISDRRPQMISNSYRMNINPIRINAQIVQNIPQQQAPSLRDRLRSLAVNFPIQPNIIQCVDQQLDQTQVWLNNMSISINGDFSQVQGAQFNNKAVLLLNILTCIVSLIIFNTIIIFMICKKMKKKITLTLILKKFEDKEKEQEFQSPFEKEDERKKYDEADEDECENVVFILNRQHTDFEENKLLNDNQANNSALSIVHKGQIDVIKKQQYSERSQRQNTSLLENQEQEPQIFKTLMPQNQQNSSRLNYNSNESNEQIQINEDNIIDLEKQNQELLIKQNQSAYHEKKSKSEASFEQNYPSKSKSRQEELTIGNGPIGAKAQNDQTQMEVTGSQQIISEIQDISQTSINELDNVDVRESIQLPNKEQVSTAIQQGPTKHENQRDYEFNKQLSNSIDDQLQAQQFLNAKHNSEMVLAEKQQDNLQKSAITGSISRARIGDINHEFNIGGSSEGAPTVANYRKSEKIKPQIEPQDKRCESPPLFVESQNKDYQSINEVQQNMIITEEYPMSSQNIQRRSQQRINQTLEPFGTKIVNIELEVQQQQNNFTPFTSLDPKQNTKRELIRDSSTGLRKSTKLNSGRSNLKLTGRSNVQDKVGLSEYQIKIKEKSVSNNLDKNQSPYGQAQKLVQFPSYNFKGKKQSGQSLSNEQRLFNDDSQTLGVLSILEQGFNPNISSKKLDALDVRAIERWRKNQQKVNKKNQLQRHFNNELSDLQKIVNLYKIYGNDNCLLVNPVENPGVLQVREKSEEKRRIQAQLGLKEKLEVKQIKNSSTQGFRQFSVPAASGSHRNPFGSDSNIQAANPHFANQASSIPSTAEYLSRDAKVNPSSLQFGVRTSGAQNWSSEGGAIFSKDQKMQTQFLQENIDQINIIQPPGTAQQVRQQFGGYNNLMESASQQKTNGVENHDSFGIPRDISNQNLLIQDGQNSQYITIDEKVKNQINTVSKNITFGKINSIQQSSYEHMNEETANNQNNPLILRDLTPKRVILPKEGILDSNKKSRYDINGASREGKQYIEVDINNPDQMKQIERQFLERKQSRFSSSKRQSAGPQSKRSGKGGINSSLNNQASIQSFNKIDKQ